MRREDALEGLIFMGLVCFDRLWISYSGSKEYVEIFKSGPDKVIWAFYDITVASLCWMESILENRRSFRK